MELREYNFDDFESKWTKVMTRKEGRAKRKGI
jgi:hypothetical protein